MAQMMLPPLPTISSARTVEELAEYVRQLQAVLSTWQLTLNSTKFLGSASGHLTLSTSLPTSADGHDDDIWIKKS